MSKSLFRSIFGYLSLVDLLVIAAAVHVYSVRMVGVADDPGLGGHLASGAYMLQQGAVPGHDPFLADGASKAWIADQWLSALGMEVLLRCGGWPLLYAVIALGLGFTGPGGVSLDHVLGLSWSWPFGVYAAALGLLAGLTMVTLRRREVAKASTREDGRSEERPATRIAA